MANDVTQWACRTCGASWSGENAPRSCPECGGAAKCAGECAFPEEEVLDMKVLHRCLRCGISAGDALKQAAIDRASFEADVEAWRQFARNVADIPPGECGDDDMRERIATALAECDRYREALCELGFFDAPPLEGK